MKTNDFRYAKRFAIFFVIVAALTVAASSAAVFAGANDQYYGREALASLPNGANYQGAYDAICQGVANKEQSISIDEFALSPFEMHGVYCTVAADHPELYFWNSSLINYSAADSVVYDVFPLYYDGLDDDAFISGAEAILASVYDTSSEYVISLALHDALVEHIIYSSSAPHAGSAYGAIVDGYAKCDGYARAYQYLLSQFGIQSFIVSGEGKGGPHAWNLVNLDGEWYYTDVTWDDPSNINGGVFHNYFNITTEKLTQDHTIINLTPNSQMPGNFVPLPDCTATTANYFVLNPDLQLSNISIDGFAKQLVKAEYAVVYCADEASMQDALSWFSNNSNAVITAAGIDNQGAMYCSTGSEIHIFVYGTRSHVHNYQATATVQPTCSTSGYTVYECECSDVIYGDLTPALGHIGGTATCQHKAVCTRCGEEYGDFAAHSFTNQTAAPEYLASAATCTEKAKYYCSCSGCGLKGCETFSYGDLAAHSYTKQMAAPEYLATEATCTEKAKYYYCCSSCDEKGSTTFDYGSALGHTGGTATCQHKAVCTRCGAEYGNLAAHSFTKQTAAPEYLASEATCTEKAKYYYCCSSCDEKGSTTFDSGSALGHTGGTATCQHKAVCTRCGAEYGNLAAHSFTKQTAAPEYLALAANCTEKAKYYCSCSVCGQKGTATFEYGDLADHSFTKRVTSQKYLASAATCTEKAKYYYCCSACGEKGSATFDSGSALGHSGGTATCQNKAVCTRCGVEYGDLAAHSFSNKTASNKYLASAATCTEKAKYYYSCSVCGQKGKTTFASGSALGHTGGTATCQNKAVCTRCGEEYGDFASHSFTNKTVSKQYLASAATCTEKAKYYCSCSVCGEKGTATFESGSALGHTGGTATCQRKAICARCGEEYGDFAPHDYSNDWTSDSAKHWHACKVCGIKSSVASHVPGPAATETEAQICSVCGRILQAASGHIHNGVVVKATSPTCLSGGNIEYFVCSCGLAFFDVECKNVVDDLSSLIIPPEHDAHSDADNDGLCDACGSAMTPKETSSETSLTEPDVESTATESTTTESSATESVTESSASAETTPEDTAAETSHGRVVFSSGFSKIIESVKNFFDSLPKKGEDGYIVFIAVIALSGAVLLTLVVVIPIKAAKRKRRRKNSKNSKNN